MNPEQMAENKRAFKEALLKSREEYIRRKNEIAQSQALERRTAEEERTRKRQRQARLEIELKS